MTGHNRAASDAAFTATLAQADTRRNTYNTINLATLTALIEHATHHDLPPPKTITIDYQGVQAHITANVAARWIASLTMDDRLWERTPIGHRCVVYARIPGSELPVVLRYSTVTGF